MVTMAERDSGVILMSKAPKSHNGSLILDAAATTSDSDTESISTLTARSYMGASETKRNKRKNFQPRNIAYSENDPVNESFSNRNPSPGDSSESELALDLSNADLVKGLDVSTAKERSTEEEENSDDDDDDADRGPRQRSHGLLESSPMDLTCSKNTTTPSPFKQMNSYFSDSDSDDVKPVEKKKRKGCGLGGSGGGGGIEPTTAESVVSSRFLQYVGHAGDALDLREYTQNMVKEYLEIAGLNSDAVTDVAQTITNHIPISNFSSGKILESLSAIGDRSTSFQLKNRNSPKSEPTTPPRSPNTLTTASRTNNAAVPQSVQTSKSKNDTSFTISKQIGNRMQFPVFSTTSGMVLPQNMATILAVASMKEQLKSKSSSSIGGDSNSTSVIITPSKLSPSNLNTDNSNSGSITIRRVSSVSPPLASKENRSSQQQTQVSLQQVVSNHPIDYSRYVKRYGMAAECGSSYCKNLNYREHFHCLDCNSRVFIKKEEMIRHFKWHKKRDESLQHGFMRYSPGDDCSDRFQNCTHNRKQTHYHCIQYVAQGTCDKVYISTSDVQMHANYHRKDSAIIQEGFQRLRATEECRTPYCAFFKQRTTHFHCRREGCQFTFKNKADMEKHKTYHIKDELLAKDGFKKFLKPDACSFVGCRFSQVCNHIHCVREGCSYVLHSSGQLLSHKRKHERKDTEIAYRKFKLTQQNLGAFNGADQLNQYPDKQLSPTNSFQLFQQSQFNAVGNSASPWNFLDNNYSNSSSEGPSSPSNSSKYRNSSIQLTGGYFTENCSPMDFSQSEEWSDSWYRYISHFSATDACPPNSKCLMNGSDHYHCKEAKCDLSFKTKEVAESHARQHEAKQRLSEQLYQEGTGYCHEESCPREKHYHCTWEGCYETILPNERVAHLKIHEISSNQFNSLDALFRRKRGRPPKNRVIEVWNEYAGVPGNNDLPQAIFTSFKLPKPSSGSFVNSSQHSDEGSSPPPSRVESPKHISQHTLEQYKFEEYTEGCPDPLCMYSSSSSTPVSHYHCKRPRCFFATNIEDRLLTHAVDFHENVEILDGFLFFDSSVDCRLENCQSNKINRHFHCIRPSCEYSFVQYSFMLEHNRKHQTLESVIKHAKENEVVVKFEPNTSTSPDTVTSKSVNVVKASGTFYPLCGITNTRSTSSPPCNNDEKAKFDIVTQVDTSTPATPVTSSATLNLLPEWLQPDIYTKFTTEVPCGRAFCKLKRKDHYHCTLCNQAFSELDKLKQHITKHGSVSISPYAIKTENNNNHISDDTDDIRHSPVVPTSLPIALDSSYQTGFNVAMAAAQHMNLAMFMPPAISGIYSSPSGLIFTPPSHAFAHPHQLMGNGLLESLPTHSANLLADSSNSDLNARSSCSPSEMSSESRRARIQTSMRILKDEPVPEGYLRFRFNEDCHYTQCGYREHQTHFHCVRRDCGYSFCDKTRFVQHTARHERLDTLMGGDFQQYRASVPCGRADCVHAASLGGNQNKASHFHCLKCDFVCTDTNKVVAHRRQHQKLDSINAAGFEKYTPAQVCSQAETCPHSGRQTHYHCLSCQYAVLGLSQMTAHKYRHDD